MGASRGRLSSKDYRDLHEFRFLIRNFLHFSEAAALAEGLEPQQHQMLLAVRALTENDAATYGPTVGRLADALLVRHHSAVGMVDRLAVHGLVERLRNENDHRQVCVRLTTEGETKLTRLSKVHRAELQNAGPALVKSLELLTGKIRTSKGIKET